MNGNQNPSDGGVLNPTRSAHNTLRYSASRADVQTNGRSQLKKVGDTKYEFWQNGQKVLDWDSKGWPIFMFSSDPNTPRVPVCGVVNDRSPDGCQGKNRGPSGRCGRHSARIFKAHDRQYQGKSMSKTIPASLVADYEKIVKDPNLLSMREDIAVVEARINQLYKRAEECYDPEIWQTAKVMVTQLDNLYKSGEWVTSPGEVASCVSDLRRLIVMAQGDENIWDEIFRAKQLKAQLIKQEQGLLKDMNGMVTKEQVAALMTAVAHATRTEIAIALQNPQTASVESISSRISARVRAIVSGVPRDEVVVMDGIPLVPIKVENGQRIN